MIRLAIMGSGAGTNLCAIIAAVQNDQLDAEIALVISDRQKAGIIAIAEKASIPTVHIDHEAADAQNKILTALRQSRADLVALAGYMRIVRAPIIEAFDRRIINIHPSLLPKYPGRKAWQQALDAGEQIAGCSVHHVDCGIDTGEVIAQQNVPILPNDTAASLHARIQKAEWALYPRVLQSFVESPISLGTH